MEFGFSLPGRGPLAKPDQVLKIALEGGRARLRVDLRHRSRRAARPRWRARSTRTRRRASSPAAPPRTTWSRWRMLGALSRVTRAGPARHQRAGHPLSPPAGDGEDPGHHRPALGRPGHPGRRRRLAARGVRGARRAAVRRARPGDRRVSAIHAGDVDHGPGELHRPLRERQQRPRAAQAGADRRHSRVDRRPHRRRRAARGHAGRRLAPDRAATAGPAVPGGVRQAGPADRRVGDARRAASPARSPSACASRWKSGPSA